MINLPCIIEDDDEVKHLYSVSSVYLIVSKTMMTSDFDDIPRRIFLDSSTLQTLHIYGGFLYENEPLLTGDPIHNDPKGTSKLEALRSIMLVAECAPFEFALTGRSFAEVERKGDPRYLLWAYDVLDHWMACLAESQSIEPDTAVFTSIDPTSHGYISAADRALLEDALALGCDTFLTMESRLPKNAGHIQKTLGIRVLSPIGMWDILSAWAALFR